GSGTTGVVCKKQNRKFVGIDNNIEYLNIAKKRLASASNRNN
ncbi:MAG: site-specific DNA-methyltransferase, partial [Deltaproteobacteria bacterium]